MLEKIAEGFTRFAKKKWQRHPTNVFCEISRGSQREILRKRPKNNNKAWKKLSEAILSILGDCWEKSICSSLPARPMGVVIGQNSALHWGGGGEEIGCGLMAKFTPSVGGRGTKRFMRNTT